MWKKPCVDRFPTKTIGFHIYVGLPGRVPPKPTFRNGDFGWPEGSQARAMSLATQVEVPRAAGRAVHFAAAEGRDGGTAVDLVPVAVGDGGQLLGNVVWWPEIPVIFMAINGVNIP